ncbi:MAG: Tad domain-containing protein, partial [Alcaligenaceae bacterium]|nr:Tad domain-containing protein [Alcaligenaceae bacterium]
MKPTLRKSFFRRLLGQQRGSVTPLFLLSFTAILGTTMGGVDLVRYNVVQNRLQNALDGATLSAGRNLENRQMANMGDPGSTEYMSWQEDAFGYFHSNMPENYLGNTIESDDLTISYSDDPLGTGYTTGQFVSMRVEGTLPLVSTGFLELTSMQVVAENQAVRHTPADIELVMALDNTGSMDRDGKIRTLREAATDLSKVLFAARDDVLEGETPRDITIGLVPFADTVNVGNTDHTRGWLSKDHLYTSFKHPGHVPEYVQTYFLKHNWMGCIAEPLPADWGAATKLPAKAWTP